MTDFNYDMPGEFYSRKSQGLGPTVLPIAVSKPSLRPFALQWRTFRRQLWEAVRLKWAESGLEAKN